MVIRVELRAFWQVIHDDLHQLIKLHALLGGHRYDYRIRVILGKQFVQGQKLGAYLVLAGLIQLGDDADDRGLWRDAAHVFQDPAVTRANLFIGRDSQADNIHIGIGVLDYLVEALAQQGARAVQARRIHDDDLRILAVHQAANGVAGGLRLVSGNRNLLPHQGIGQRGLAGIRAPDKGYEARAETLRGIGVLRIIKRGCRILGAFRHGIIGVFWKALECRLKLCIKIRTHYPQ